MRGTRYGRLVIIEEADRIAGMKKGQVVYHRAVLCRCDCGIEVVVKLSNLSKTGSCGCLKSEVMTVLASERFRVHGASGHPLFKLWQHIIERCENRNSKSFPDYGGRGITVCERWHDPWKFFEDIERELGPQPPGRTPGGMPLYTLDRENNNGNYEPGNVRWADWLTQAANSRNHLERRPVQPGERFGRLVVLREAEPQSVDDRRKPGRVLKYRVILCRCDCGSETPVRLGNLVSGGTSSCGCLRREVALQNSPWVTDYKGGPAPDGGLPWESGGDGARLRPV